MTKMGYYHETFKCESLRLEVLSNFVNIITIWMLSVQQSHIRLNLTRKIYCELGRILPGILDSPRVCPILIILLLHVLCTIM